MEAIVAAEEEALAVEVAELSAEAAAVQASNYTSTTQTKSILFRQTLAIQLPLSRRQVTLATETVTVLLQSMG